MSWNLNWLGKNILDVELERKEKEFTELQFIEIHINTLIQQNKQNGQN